MQGFVVVRSKAHFLSKAISTGFTLIEMVIGIVAFSAVLTIVIGVISPQATRSVDPIFNVRAAELAQSLFNEISAKSFDENSSRGGGSIRCNDDLDGDDLFTSPGEIACTTTMGPDDATELSDREFYDDVDDYDGLNVVANSFGDAVIIDGRDLYAGFNLSVRVFYDADFNGADDGAVGTHKLINITVTTPLGQSMVFSAYRSNY